MIKKKKIFSEETISIIAKIFNLHFEKEKCLEEISKINKGKINLQNIFDNLNIKKDRLLSFKEVNYFLFII